MSSREVAGGAPAKVGWTRGKNGRGRLAKRASVLRVWKEKRKIEILDGRTA